METFEDYNTTTDRDRYIAAAAGLVDINDLPEPVTDRDKLIAAVAKDRKAIVDTIENVIPITGKFIDAEEYIHGTLGDDIPFTWKVERFVFYTIYYCVLDIPSNLDPEYVDANDLALEIEGKVFTNVQYVLNGNVVTSLKVNVDGMINSYTSGDAIRGLSARLVRREYVFPDCVLNLYDEDDPHGDESFLPVYAENDDGYLVISAKQDMSAFYKALNSGKPCYLRHYAGEGVISFDLVFKFVPDYEYDFQPCLYVESTGLDVCILTFLPPPVETDEEDNDSDIEDNGSYIIDDPLPLAEES